MTKAPRTITATWHDRLGNAMTCQVTGDRVVFFNQHRIACSPVNVMFMRCDLNGDAAQRAAIVNAAKACKTSAELRAALYNVTKLGWS